MHREPGMRAVASGPKHGWGADCASWYRSGGNLSCTWLSTESCGAVLPGMRWRGQAPGALGGAEAGAMVGSFGGPVGIAAGGIAGGIIGGVAGAVAGSGLGEALFGWLSDDSS
jgi:hypothetical protein